MLRIRLLNLSTWASRSMSAFRPFSTTQFRRLAEPGPSKGDSELVNFITEEIATETKGKRSTPVAKSLDAFSVSTKQAEVKLTRKYNNEEITVSLNVNHTVDADAEDGEDGEAARADKQPQEMEMKSRPNFDIDIKKGNQTLSFSCSFIQDEEAPEAQDEYNDLFLIDEIKLYEGEWKDEIYAVAGDILDGYMYDLFMNMLEERGVTNEFVDKLSELSTEYEHKLYVEMLQKLQTFFSK